MNSYQSTLSTALPTDQLPLDTGLDLEVKITGELASVEVMHAGRKVTIKRNQNQNNPLNTDYAQTSRKCPPFCIQPGELAPGVKTIAELEVLQFLKKINDGDALIMVVDSRTSDWVNKGTIPGTVNIPWNTLDIDKSVPLGVQEILENQIGAKRSDDTWVFDNAKTLVFVLQWPVVRTVIDHDQGGLLKIDYPADKILCYRGGMQDWESLGLSTLKPLDK